MISCITFWMEFCVRNSWRQKNLAEMAKARGWDCVPYTMVMRIYQKASIKQTCRVADPQNILNWEGSTRIIKIQLLQLHLAAMKILARYPTRLFLYLVNHIVTQTFSLSSFFSVQIPARSESHFSNIWGSIHFYEILCHRHKSMFLWKKNPKNISDLIGSQREVDKAAVHVL